MSDVFIGGADPPDSLAEYGRRMRGSAEYHRGLVELPRRPEFAEKFDRDGNAKPLLGYTAVQWVDSASELYRHLDDVTSGLARQLDRTPKSAWFFLPPPTFHATICNLVVRPDETTKAELPRLMARRAFPALAGQQLAAPRLEARGVRVMGGGTIAVMLHPADARSLETIGRIREALQAGLDSLGDRIPEVKPDDFFGHITLAYAVDDLFETEYNEVKDVLAPVDDLRLGELVIDRVELRAFESMVEWSPPLATLELTAP